MQWLRKVPALLAVLLFTFPAFGQSAEPVNTRRPWTYWWWMGSAVREDDITRQLEQFSGAGLGGVHIIPIYGVKGKEAEFIPFLSERWLAVFSHTVREARRLGLGVDLSTGTGWPFGGPNVTTDIAAKHWVVQGDRLMASPTKQQVKRAAPGGAGTVVDHFSPTAVRRYLTRFDSTLVRLKERPRAVYNDSYEVYGANWTERFGEEFRRRRGYELHTQVAALRDTTRTEVAVRVKQDFHQTLSELLEEGFTKTWTDWARGNGYRSRNQAHGSPGNLLDLYALTDIPETESFGSSRFPIPGLRVDENYEVDRFGTPHPLAMKFASSAAHLTGKPLVSSETGTWLADHFKVALSQIKPQVDELFMAGINHIFYHGTTYSPAAEPYPGWLFYASTNYGPSSHFWPHLPLLNQYIERCQTRLQNSRPDNDVLVYFPIHDLWATPAKSSGGIHQLEVHHVERWLLPLPFGRLCEQLWQQGFSFDYVSDKQLERLTVDKSGTVQTGAAAYRVIVVPASTYLPPATAAQLLRLARQGARIVFGGSLDRQAPGFHNAAARTAELRRIGESLRKLPSVTVTTEIAPVLNRLGGRQEAWTQESGLRYIRKKSGDSTIYFIANLSDRFREGPISLATEGKSVSRYDPLTDRVQAVPIRVVGRRTELQVSLLPGQSCFLTVRPAAGGAAAGRTVASSRGGAKGAAFRTMASGPWKVQFLSGRPALKTASDLPQPASWTTLGDSAGYFSGTARYSTSFDLPAGIDTTQEVTLDLGQVREVAEVRLNGQPVGTAWCLPFQVTIPANRLNRRGNRLDIDVTNVSANYMRLVDRQYPGWKKFYDINIVTIQYKPLNIARWEPVPSGLLGPVRLGQ